MFLPTVQPALLRYWLIARMKEEPAVLLLLMKLHTDLITTFISHP